MAQLIKAFSCLLPAGTTPAAPTKVPMVFPPAVVTRIELRVPAGPRGLVGFAIASSGTPILPDNAGAWIITDDEVILWDVADQPDSGDWQLIGYNTGRNPHTIQVRFLNDLTNNMPAPVAHLPSTNLLSM